MCCTCWDLFWLYISLLLCLFDSHLCKFNEVINNVIIEIDFGWMFVDAFMCVFALHSINVVLYRGMFVLHLPYLIYNVRNVYICICFLNKFQYDLIFHLFCIINQFVYVDLSATFSLEWLKYMVLLDVFPSLFSLLFLLFINI